jgi:hypothetical protein
MTVDRTHDLARQTRYVLKGDSGLACVLTYTAAPDEPAIWKVLRPGPGGTEDLYSTRRVAAPDARWLQAWLTPVVGAGQAAELAEAVDAAPPPAAYWRKHDSHEG